MAGGRRPGVRAVLLPLRQAGWAAGSGRLAQPGPPPRPLAAAGTKYSASRFSTVSPRWLHFVLYTLYLPVDFRPFRHDGYTLYFILCTCQSIFDRFDTMAETFSVQRVRKTVNESYMVASGLPDPSLLSDPGERALAIAGLGFAMVHVMDVVSTKYKV